jgi:hypothetical protein
MIRAKSREEVQSLTVTSGEVRVPNATTFSREYIKGKIVNSLVKVSAEGATTEVLRTINRALRGESEPTRKATESAPMGSPTQ